MLYVTAYNDKLLLEARNLLPRLLEAYSPSGRESEAVDVALEWLQAHKFYARVDENGNLLSWTSKPVDKPCLALVSHIDTVEGFLPVVVDGDVVRGRGAVDAKGPLAAMMLSLLVLRGVPGIMLAALVDEEGDSRGAWGFIDAGFRPKYIIIGEPTGHGVVVSYRGSLRARILCRARGGHSSSPWVGGSALDILIDGIQEIRSNGWRDNVGAIYSVTYLNAGRGDNVLPEQAEAIIDVRIPPGASYRDIESFLYKIFGKCLITISLGVKPVRVKPQDPVPRSIIRALLSHGLRPRILQKTGTSDMNILYKYTESIAAYGPGDSSLAHTRDEHISLNDIVLAAFVYADAARNLCA